jgi:hypothetical protein
MKRGRSLGSSRGSSPPSTVVQKAPQPGARTPSDAVLSLLRSQGPFLSKQPMSRDTPSLQEF